MQDLLRFERVSKRFAPPRSGWWGARPAPARVLTDLELRVRPGERVAIVGANGSGKTTLQRLAAGVLAPDDGRVVAPTRGSGLSPIGYSGGGERSLVWRVSVAENLCFFGSLHGLRRREARRRIPGEAEALGLTDLLERPVSVLSSGQRQRVSLAVAGLHEPALLLLDEPFRSLDDAGRALVDRWLDRRRSAGAAVLVTSPTRTGLETWEGRQVLRGGSLHPDGPGGRDG